MKDESELCASCGESEDTNCGTCREPICQGCMSNCSKCGKDLCENCVVNSKEKEFCSDCAEELQKMTEEVKKIDKFSPEWQKMANRIARDHAPPIYPCMKCGAPYISGHICTHCGTDNPTSEE